MAATFSFADLTYLESMSMGSNEMVAEMIQLFLEQIPEFTSEMVEFLSKEDFSALGALAHKAKSSVAVMGMDELAGILKTLELKSKAGEDPDSYLEMVTTFCHQVQVTGEELEAHLKTLT